VPEENLNLAKLFTLFGVYIKSHLKNTSYTRCSVWNCPSEFKCNAHPFPAESVFKSKEALSSIVIYNF
jgi:hypothetical protein